MKSLCWLDVASICPQIKSTSMLPYSGHGFAQAPKEPISAEGAERSVSVFGDVQAVYEALHSEDKLMDLVDSRL